MQFGSYDNFRNLAINSKEKLDMVAKENPNGNVIYYVYNLGYRSFISILKIYPDYLTLTDDSIPHDIRKEVDKKYNSFSFRAIHLNKDLTVDKFSDGSIYDENMNSASCGVHGNLCNKHLLFTCPHMAQAYLNWAKNDQQSNIDVKRLDEFCNDLMDIE